MYHEQGGYCGGPFGVTLTSASARVNGKQALHLFEQVVPVPGLADLVIEAGGGLAVAADGIRELLPLPVAGLMSTQSCAEVGEAYQRLDQRTKQLGSQLRAPFMTLSFMALLVIPEIKLSDKGLFDGNRFRFMPLFG